MTMVIAIAISCYVTISSGFFCRMNKWALSHHLVYFYSVSVPAFAFWNILGHDLLVPKTATSLFLFFFSHLKHLVLIPKCGYLHTCWTGFALSRKVRWPLFLPGARPSPAPSVQSRGLMPGGRSTTDFWQSTDYISHPWLGRNLVGPSLLFSVVLLWVPP